MEEVVNISAKNLDYRKLNELIKGAQGQVRVSDCFGQRYIGCGLAARKIDIIGTPGNALGAYLNGGIIRVDGNAQDAVGDTMNDGKIIVHGNAGDALGYAMRGGQIYIKGNAGYRTGIHMKEYKDKKTKNMVGGRVGRFLGEYLEGGVIVILGLYSDDAPVGNFTGTGMHGGIIFIRAKGKLKRLPVQVSAETASKEDMEEISAYLAEFAGYFNIDTESLTKDQFYVLRPNAKNPYKQMYVAN
jgi:glutamate synthase domain-containing protein 3